MTKHDALLASVRSQMVWNNMDVGDAIQSAINGVWPLRPDYAKAELYTRLMERWNDYAAGIPRKIFVKAVVAEWNYWYVRYVPPTVEAEEEVADGE